MNTEKLANLLLQSERPDLEFKSEWYRIDDPNQNIQEASKHELVKDILALANGVPNKTADPTYLIIGAADKLDENGNRPVFDVNPSGIDRKTILDILDSYSNPRIPNLNCHSLSFQEKTLVVIELAPSYSLHETTKRLTTKGDEGKKTKTYQEFTVFVRHGESISIASQQERETIQAMKRVSFTNVTHVEPTSFGAIIGAIIGGIFLPPAGEKILGKKEGYQAGLIVGPLVGGFLGGMIGNTSKEYLETRIEWKYYSTKKRAALLAIFPLAVLFWRALVYIFNKIPKMTSKS